MHSAIHTRTMRPIAADGVVWSLCLLVTFVSFAKPIEMPFGC